MRYSPVLVITCSSTDKSVLLTDISVQDNWRRERRTLENTRLSRALRVVEAELGVLVQCFGFLQLFILVFADDLAKCFSCGAPKFKSAATTKVVAALLFLMRRNWGEENVEKINGTLAGYGSDRLPVICDGVV